MKGEHTMKKTELKNTLAEYQEIAAQIAELEKQKAAVAERIKAHMEAAGVEELQVDDTIARYREIVSQRFDARAFQQAHKRLYGMFCKPQAVRRFTVA